MEAQEAVEEASQEVVVEVDPPEVVVVEPAITFKSLAQTKCVSAQLYRSLWKTFHVMPKFPNWSTSSRLLVT